ncbi:MAG: hypothetical protein K6T77_00700 [candidate division WOR-3 bacterium]|nr:hypothetical protein [candidate division WOR-3 bacterium]
MRKEGIAFAAAAIVFLALTLPVFAEMANNSPCLCGAKITPIQGSARNVYIAQVRYSDPDNDPPAKVEVYIDGIAYPMRRVKGKPSAGIYQARLTLPMGEHKYYFYAEDVRGMSIRFPRYGEKPGPFVGAGKQIYDRLPVLSNGGVHEDYITGTNMYTFTVDYLDKDGKNPQAVRVVIDGIPRDMALLQGTPAAGVYYYKTTLPPGNHVYYFAAIDDCGSCVLHPKHGVIYGPTVGEIENHQPVLMGEKVEPAAGYPNTIFTYYVEYRDPNNDPPARAEIYINGKPSEMRLVGGKPYTGIYQYKTRLYPGAFHNYYFYFEDGKGGFCRYPEIGYFHGPIVTR